MCFLHSESEQKDGGKQEFVFKDHYLPTTNASLENQLADA